MRAKKHVGLVGFGYWGKNIFRNLHDLGVLHTACDSSLNVVLEHKDRFPDVHYTHVFNEVIDNPDVTAVVIATPAVTHYEIAKKALSAGKDVFVEKPLALSVNHGKELAKLAASENKILMVGHILRYHPAVEKLKELITAGELGKVQYIYSNRLNMGKLRTEENILWSFAPHDISVILHLVDDEPIAVSAFGEKWLNEGVYDTTLTTLEFKNGVKGHIFVSWLHPYKEQKLIVVGSKAMAVFDDTSKEKLLVYPHRIEWRQGKIPVALKAEHVVVPVGCEEPLRHELEHFLECTRSRKKPRTDADEGVRVIQVLEQAERALENRNERCVQPDAKKYYVHESAYVDENVTIGDGTKVWHFSHVLKNTKIGNNCVLGQNVVVGPNVKIGNKVKIQNNVSVYDGVELEDDVFCGPSMVFTNVINPRSFIERKAEFKKTLVRQGATIGANATIVCGATIGAYAFIGAGAVVNKNVPDYALMVGVPAKQIGWVCACGVTLHMKRKKSVVCMVCGNKYTINGSILVDSKENV